MAVRAVSAGVETGPDPDRHPKGLYVLFATEMFGAVNAIDPKTGRNFEDLVPIFQEIDWLTKEERYKITEGNVRKLFTRIFDGSEVR